MTTLRSHQSWPLECTKSKQKLNFLQSLTYSKSLDIISVTETWLSAHTYDHEILPSDYTVYRRDRPNNGEGILIATLNCISSHLFLTHPNVEMILIEITQPLQAHICCLQIPPSSLESYMLELLHAFNSLPRNTLLLINGDFNCPRH